METGLYTNCKFPTLVGIFLNCLFKKNKCQSCMISHDFAHDFEVN